MKNRLRRSTMVLLMLSLAAAGCDNTDPEVDAGPGGADAATSDSGTTDAGSTDSTSFVVRWENIGTAYAASMSGVINVPAGATAPAPLMAGESYVFRFRAHPGQNLTFATMFVRSNDFFYSPAEAGIALFAADGTPTTGDVTDQIMIWDAGTEMNEMAPGGLGAGPNTVMNQAGPNMGADDATNMVRLAAGYTDLPPASDVASLSLSAEIVDGGWMFTATLTNASMPGVTAFPTPMSPGVFAVFSGTNPLFTAGEADRGMGLEGIAEDGDPTALGASLEAVTGLTVVSSPGVVAVHSAGGALFMGGMPDRGVGLEALAEDGMPMALRDAARMRSDVSQAEMFNMPVGATMPGPLTPGNAYEVTVSAEPGDLLSLVAMFVPSNDLLFALPGTGIALFDSAGVPLSGDITDQLLLIDAGTEENQFPGVGLDQVHLQSAANTGADDPMVNVRRENDDFSYPAITDVLRVTVTPSP